ncbi:hypothetical protein TSUD_334670 [Trifolium subterraneum]|uniref:DUF761 domain-containing protein n=1 Tax=Trifolium subterraneum TaxID=3900 RepID=A0A2Z6LGF4_TRISU|nr:hypothetical protein TSUD_334670 [Trifolium subterraneum]
MSCISLRLPPARKVWKSFTSKLGSKLHNIRKSKAMKKQRKHLKPSTSITTKPPKFHATKRFRRKKFATVRSVFCSFNKKPAPVYIDKLFKEPACDVVGYLKPETINYRPQIEIAAKIDDYQRGKKEVAEGSTSKRSCEKTSSSSDDMWESVALASPQMQGIDERAEEFITRFRRQMAAQERLARNL